MATGTVKFFNATRGYGFITPDVREPGQRDVWVGISELERSGLRTLYEGQRVEYVQVEIDDRGRSNAINLKITAPVMGTGTVKWFDPRRKGYGFIQPNDGGNDVFIHVSAVQRARLSTLLEG